MVDKTYRTEEEAVWTFPNNRKNKIILRVLTFTFFGGGLSEIPWHNGVGGHEATQFKHKGPFGYIWRRQDSELYFIVQNHSADGYTNGVVFKLRIPHA